MMTVIFSDEVISGINSYFDSLSGYGVSYEKSFEKYCNMLHEVENAAKKSDFCQYQICMFADWGQTFNKDGEPIKTNLRNYIYKDKQSGSKWAFSRLIDT